MGKYQIYSTMAMKVCVIHSLVFSNLQLKNKHVQSNWQSFVNPFQLFFCCFCVNTVISTLIDNCPYSTNYVHTAFFVGCWISDSETRYFPDAALQQNCVWSRPTMICLAQLSANLVFFLEHKDQFSGIVLFLFYFLKIKRLRKLLHTKNFYFPAILFKVQY